MVFFLGTSWSPPDQEFTISKYNLQWINTKNITGEFFVGGLPNPNLSGDTDIWYPATIIRAGSTPDSIVYRCNGDINSYITVGVYNQSFPVLKPQVEPFDFEPDSDFLLDIGKDILDYAQNFFTNPSTLASALTSGGLASATAMTVAKQTVPKMLLGATGFGGAILAGQLALTAMKYLSGRNQQNANISIPDPKLFIAPFPYTPPTTVTLSNQDSTDINFSKDESFDRYKETARSWQEGSGGSALARNDMVNELKDKFLDSIKREIPDSDLPSFNETLFKQSLEWQEFQNKLNEKLENSIRNKANGGKKKSNEVMNSKLDKINSKLSKLDRLDSLIDIAFSLSGILNKECCDLSEYFKLQDGRNIAQVFNDKDCCDLSEYFKLQDGRNIAQVLDEKDLSSSSAVAVLEGSEMIY